MYFPGGLTFYCFGLKLSNYMVFKETKNTYILNIIRLILNQEKKEK